MLNQESSVLYHLQGNFYYSMLDKIRIILILCLCLNTRADIFTAITEVEQLLETHQIVTYKLNEYIKKEERRLSILNRYAEMYRKEHEIVMNNIPKYLGNPINAFRLIKQLTSDLDYIQIMIKTQTGFNLENKTNYNMKSIKYPTEEDLKGAAEALALIQDTYNMNVTELAEGRLHGTAYSTIMTASDCYELGRTLYKAKDFANSLAWMIEALRKFKEDKISYPFCAVDVLDFICFGYYELGDMRNALNWAQKIIDLDPNNSRANQVAQICQKRIEDEHLARKVTSENNKTDLNDPMEKADYPLCRGDIDIPMKISSRLSCRYMFETHPFLKLAPFKVEMIYVNPNIVLFHDVLHDDEINTIKEMAKPLLMRSILNNPTTDQPNTSKFRICKSAWLKDAESDIIARISRRVTDMTGLSTETAEDLHVVNYGIGGHYKSHYDFAKRKHSLKWEGGNRIATVLFYMSDVALGGATVFSKLGLSVRPRKGAAIFWYNLHPSGEGDLATKHTACPVLQGDKWVSTKWIHEWGQEFRRPCNLEYQAQDILHKIPEPVSTRHNHNLQLGT